MFTWRQRTYSNTTHIERTMLVHPGLQKGHIMGSLKFSGKPGKKDSIKIDSIPQALDIRLLRLDRGVIDEGDSSRVRS